jgi:hypothetical protein
MRGSYEICIGYMYDLTIYVLRSMPGCGWLDPVSLPGYAHSLIL